MTRVFYPRGGGGNWLSNLIWHLEKADFSLPEVTVIFDQQPQCSIPFSHGLHAHSRSHTLFSCKQLFNHYLNNAVKVKYHIHHIHQLSWQQQLFELSNGAKHYLSSSDYYKFYCESIDLDYSLIFQQPEKFADCLIDFLNATGIAYTANRNYIHASMSHYTTTCADPTDHIGNWDSMLWLGFCHAITILDQLPIDVIMPDADPDTIVKILQPHAEYYLQRTTPLAFEWATK